MVMHGTAAGRYREVSMARKSCLGVRDDGSKSCGRNGASGVGLLQSPGRNLEATGGLRRRNLEYLEALIVGCVCEAWRRGGQSFVHMKAKLKPGKILMLGGSLYGTLHKRTGRSMAVGLRNRTSCTVVTLRGGVQYMRVKGLLVCIIRGGTVQFHS